MIGLNCRVSTQVVSTDISTDTSTDISVEAPHKIHDPQSKMRQFMHESHLIDRITRLEIIVTQV